MSEQYKDMVRRTFEQIRNRGNLAVIDEWFARDYDGHSATENRGAEGTKQFAAAMGSAFPDLQYTVEDKIVEGDRVVHCWTARGTHAGEFQGISPTARQVTIPASAFTASAAARLQQTSRLIPRFWRRQPHVRSEDA